MQKLQEAKLKILFLIKLIIQDLSIVLTIDPRIVYRIWARNPISL